MSTVPPASPTAGVQSLLAGHPYRALELIGRGGMGEVHLVEHTFLKKRFALKVLHARFGASSTHADRMRIEARVVGQFQHPHIVEVIDFWTPPEGRPCIVMELLRGRTLADELDERKQIPAEEAVDITRQTLLALGAAHAAGIVHRDIKPENLFLHEKPPSGRVLKVLDFGIARVAPAAAADAQHLTVRTETGARVGSPGFMSPEAVRGERLDERADIYSLGVVLYRMLAGRGPFDYGETDARPPSRFASASTGALDELILRAIEEQAEDRFQTAADFAQALIPFFKARAP